MKINLVQFHRSRVWLDENLSQQQTDVFPLLIHVFGFSIISTWKVSLFPKWSGRAKISGQFNQRANGNIGSQTVWNHCISTYRKIEKKHRLSNGAVHKCAGLLILEIWWWIVVHFLYLPNRTWPLVIKFRHRHIPDIMNFPHGIAETSYSWEPDWG